MKKSLIGLFVAAAVGAAAWAGFADHYATETENAATRFCNNISAPEHPKKQCVNRLQSRMSPGS